MKPYWNFPAGTRVVYKTAGRPVEYGVVTGAGAIGVFVLFEGTTTSKLCAQDLWIVTDWYQYLMLQKELDLEEID